MAWNRPTSNTVDATSSARPAGRGRRPGLKHGILAGAIIVVLGALCCFVFRPSAVAPKRDTDKERGRIKEVTPAKVSKAKEPLQPAKPQVEPGPARDNRYGGIWRGKRIMEYTATTNGTSIYEHIVTEDGKKHGIIDSTVKPIYENASDQMIAFALMHDGIHELPPMPINASLDAEFKASLKKPITINENDTDEVKQMKQDIMAVREEMKERIANGMTFHEALEQHFKEQNENVALRAKAVEDVKKILASGDREGAEKYVGLVNESLEKMGAMPIELPSPRVKGGRRKQNGPANPSME